MAKRNTRNRRYKRKSMRGGNFSQEENLNQNSKSGGKHRRRVGIGKTRKLRQSGGTCYGKGVGANSYDPNYSIYNTNMLKLFPYRSN